MGLSSTFARLGGIIAPLVIALQNLISWLPYAIFGVAAAIAAVMSVTLPETAKINMMEGIEEAEEFYRGKVKEELSHSTGRYIIKKNPPDKIKPSQLCIGIRLQATFSVYTPSR